MRLRGAIGKALGFLVNHRGIAASPTKISAILEVKGPETKCDIMKITDMMAALSRFIIKLGEKGMSFFKILKKTAPEASEALVNLKTYMTPCYQVSSLSRFPC